MLDRLPGADLSGCDLSGVRLRGVSLRGATLCGAKLRHADLTKADLTDADLTGADLTGAKLTGAKLMDARFDGTTLARVSLVGASVDPLVEARAVAAGGAPVKIGDALLCMTLAAPTSAVAFGRGGSLLAAACGRTVWLVDAETGVVLRVLQGHTNEVQSVAFSPDGSLLATASDFNTACLWEVDSGRTRATFQGHESTVPSVAFSPDGSLLATGSADGTTRLWDVADGRCVLILVAIGEARVAFTPDGRYRSDGDLRGHFWHAVNLCRFEPGELDEYLDLRVPEGIPLLPPRPPEALVTPQHPSLLPSAVAGVSVGLAAFATSALALGLPYGAAALAATLAGVGAAAVPPLVHRLRRR